MAQVRDDGGEVVEKRHFYDKNQVILQPIKNRDYKTTSKQSTCRILNCCLGNKNPMHTILKTI